MPESRSGDRGQVRRNHRGEDLERAVAENPGSLPQHHRSLFPRRGLGLERFQKARPARMAERFGTQGTPGQSPRARMVSEPTGDHRLQGTTRRVARAGAVEAGLLLSDCQPRSGLHRPE